VKKESKSPAGSDPSPREEFAAMRMTKDPSLTAKEAWASRSDIKTKPKTQAEPAEAATAKAEAKPAEKPITFEGKPAPAGTVVDKETEYVSVKASDNPTWKVTIGNKTYKPESGGETFSQTDANGLELRTGVKLSVDKSNEIQVESGSGDPTEAAEIATARKTYGNTVKVGEHTYTSNGDGTFGIAGDSGLYALDNKGTQARLEPGNVVNPETSGIYRQRPAVGAQVTLVGDVDNFPATYVGNGITKTDESTYDYIHGNGFSESLESREDSHEAWYTDTGLLTRNATKREGVERREFVNSQGNKFTPDEDSDIGWIKTSPDGLTKEKGYWDYNGDWAPI